MSKSKSQRSLLKELERTESILQDLLTTISNLNVALQPIEHKLKVSDFASSGEYIQGVSKGIVCVPTGLIQGDPLEKILTERGRGRGIPALIKSGDRSESPITVESILNMLLAEDRKQSLEYIINLRWAELPAPLEKEMIVIRGSRYVSGNHLRLSKLEKDLEKLGFKVIRDKGEFGGGPLSYKIVKSFDKKRNLMVVELTLSRQIVENSSLVIQILNTLASF
ncbi:MAG: hypothetical protein ACFFDQ_04710 [Candidatus Thorarchaeota archaeon]